MLSGRLMSRLEFKNISKSFGEVSVLEDVNFNVEPQEFVVLLGPSGCGKTTVLRMVAGLEHPSFGSILLDRENITDIPPRLHNVAMVFQNYALYPHMNVAQNMAFGLKMRHLSKGEIISRVKGAASLLGIEALLKRMPRQLSGGQKQRVAMGRAIVRRPKIFLFDEPLSNLDAALRVKMRTEIKKLHQKLKITTLYVTHDQVEAMTLGSKIVLLHDGKIQQIDSPAEIYKNPTNLFVAGFIGSPAMNFIKASVDDKGVIEGWGRIESLPGVKQIIIGIRPEDFHIDHPETKEAKSITGEVQVVEPLGARVQITVNFNDQELTALLPAKISPQPQENISLSCELAHIHLFDGATGERLNTSLKIL